MARLKDKIALVTGSAAGIGLATIERLAAEGAHVYVTDVDGAGAEKAAAALVAKGLHATAMTVDVSRGQDVTALVRAIEQQHGQLDVVVNNAGINVRTDFRNMSDADWVRLREVNLDGMVRIARDTFPLMKASGKASLINLASIMGHRGMRTLAAYGATKGAMSALTRGLAVEYAPFGIRVNALAPGFIETALTERVLRIEAFSKALLEQTPLRRFGSGEDVANAVLFFASDESAYITGAELAIDGGMQAAL
ncbi:SDR family NAD(P)-dependent oxidoreductase [Hyphomicrobium sp. D-2]|uniref:SDR family NAD(P)-dependent oxidoreductase n=1 Tax=Hyphomicrobium sp. D-2 TaxID=3041621 RepID=UPI002458601E|nr:SDR family NAD(P)-dependent oxidoreductase [Hyphomicrobium sp. D-2]MDH4981478.1 SDR family NAD(P)-dependent oxidoreductase [Hyphomicrobium sp. D-2]